jgi:hypothetical protein
VPFLSIPLVLNFFADTERIGALASDKLQQLIEAVMYEVGAVALPGFEVEPPTQVPADVDALKRQQFLQTQHGRLMHEMQHAAATTFQPLLRMCEASVQLCAGKGANTSFVSVMLFVARIVARVHACWIDVCVRNSAGGGLISDRDAGEEAVDALQQYLQKTLCPRVHKALAEMQRENDVPGSCRLHMHLSMLYGNMLRDTVKKDMSVNLEREGLMKRYMLSTAYLVAWGSQIHHNEAILISQLPLHDVMRAHIGMIPIILAGVASNRRDLLLDALPAVALLKEGSAQETEHSVQFEQDDLGSSAITRSQWNTVLEKPMQCKKIIESAHPYSCGVGTFDVFTIEACERIELYFDPRSATEEDADIISVYAGHDFSRLIQRLSGKGPWPGTNGIDPLVVPGNKFSIHFEADKSITGWGYKLEARADVNKDLKMALTDELGASEKDAERALANNLNSYTKAQDELERGGQVGRDDGLAKDGGTGGSSSGFFRNKDNTVQVSLHTAEVLLDERMLMPVQAEVAAEEAFQDVFFEKDVDDSKSDGSGDTNADYCAEKERKECCKKLLLMRTDNAYEVDVWGPRSRVEEMISYAKTSVEKYRDNATTFHRYNPGDPFEFYGSESSCINLPARVAVDRMRHLGTDYVEYQPKCFGSEDSWVPELYETMLSKTFGSFTIDVPEPTQQQQWALDSSGTESKLSSHGALEGARVLYFLEPQGQTQREKAGNPGHWYEVHADQMRKVLHVYLLVEVGRLMQRQLVCTSDARYSLGDLSSPDHIVQPGMYAWPKGLRHMAGSMCGGALNSEGRPIIPQGRPSYMQVTISSLVIARAMLEETRKLLPASHDGEEERDTERYISPSSLTGIIPGALLDQYKFWRTGERTIRGYPRDGSGVKGTSLYIVMTTHPACGDQLSAKSTSAVVKNQLRAKSTCAVVKRHQQAADGAGAGIWHTLLNLQRQKQKQGNSRRDILKQISNVLCRLDNLSHILVWSHSDARAEEECSVDLVELPRLQLKFSVQKDEYGMTRLFSEDENGWYVREEGCDDVREEGCDGGEAKSSSRSRLQEFTHIIEQSVVLENSQRERALLVPNYDIIPFAFSTCPFSTALFLLRGQRWRNFRKHSRLSTYFLYKVHPSGSYLQTKSLSEALYLLTIYLYKREYALAASVMPSVFTDVRFNSEERYLKEGLGMMGDSKAHNFHPDAIALRLQIFAVMQESGEPAPEKWNPALDFELYVRRWHQVSVVCRLTAAEEELLAVSVANINRKQYLRSVLDSEGKSSNKLIVMEAQSLKKAQSCGESWSKMVDDCSAAEFGDQKIARLERCGRDKEEDEKLFMTYLYQRPERNQSRAKQIEVLQQFMSESMSKKTMLGLPVSKYLRSMPILCLCYDGAVNVLVCFCECVLQLCHDVSCCAHTLIQSCACCAAAFLLGVSCAPVSVRVVPRCGGLQP